MRRLPSACLLLATALLAGCPSPGPDTSRDLGFSPAELPEGAVGQPYRAVITVSNTDTPVCGMSLSSGALPAGLTITFRKDEGKAEIAGMPTAAGRNTFTLGASCFGTQRTGQSGQRTYELVVK